MTGNHKILILLLSLFGILPVHAINIDYCNESGIRSCTFQIPKEELPDTLLNNVNPCLYYPIYEPVRAKGELAWLKHADLPQEPVLETRIQIERKEKCLEVSFCPYVKKGIRYYRLASFEWGWKNRTCVLSGITSKDLSAGVPLFASSESNKLNDPSRYASHSRLSEGKWIKISIPSTGVYSISYKDLKNNDIDPNKAQIYGYGGHMLAEDFSKPYTDDLPPVPVYRDENKERLVFYGVGPCRWSYNDNLAMFVRENNPYSTKGYYFIGERDEGSLTMEQVSSSSSPSVCSSSYTDLQLHEKDLYNLGKTGRECYGEDFITTGSQEFSFDMDHALTDKSSRLMVEFVARSTSTSTVKVSIDNKNLATMTVSSISADNSYTYANAVKCIRDFTPTADDDDISIAVSYQSSGGKVTAAHLNYIILNVRKQLYISDKVLLFRDPDPVKQGACCQYSIQGADESVILLDVTDPLSVKQVIGNCQNGEYSFAADCSSLHEYAAVKLGGNLEEATIEGSVVNQDLHSLGQPKLVIIAPEEFLEQAQILANAHKSHDGISVVTVSAAQVYNEFSSGTPDATAYRRFMKMFYDRSENKDDMPQSLLLFGDGVYDNRLVTNTFKYNSSDYYRLMTYQSEESLEGTLSFVSDDYFGFLDDNEGSSLATDRMDIGVGRFPVKTQEEAAIAVNKALYYMKNSDLGPWKNTLCFMADDGDDNSHVNHANTLADLVTDQHPEFIINKVYIDSYDRVSTTSGSTTPDAGKRFKNLLNSGLLMLNYSGHGSTTAWTAEGLLTYQDIQQMRNIRLPLWITATCDFCRYDDSEESGGETVFKNSNGGAIALITTSRIVYSGPNFTLNKALISNLFNRDNNIRLTLGEVMRQAKTSSALLSDRNKLNFALIGDPALKLGYPEYRAKITEINGHEVDELHPDTARSMSLTNVEGEIINTDDSLAGDFDGTLYSTVFDAAANAQTLGNNGNDVFTFTDRSNTLYTGKATVRNGRFSFSFIVPKDQSYSYRTGLINLYACSEKSPASDAPVTEAQGVFEDFILGGSDQAGSKDVTGPEIQLYLNSLTFKDGETVNSSPTLIALLKDSSGINTSTNAVGHDIMLIIDDKEHISLNHTFETDIDSYTSGTLYYNISELSNGEHTLSLKAWDTQNNSSSKSLSFNVEAGQEPIVKDLEFYQTSQKAWFHFTHNRPMGWMSAKMTVYDIYGRLIWQSSSSMYNRTNESGDIEWDYTGEGGIRVGNGVYVCHLLVDDGDGIQCVATRKILISTQ